MTTSKVFHFKPSQVYGVPNWKGLALFFVVGAALYFSILNNSWVERWIFILMILIILFHLAELNDQFKSMSYRLPFFIPPFAGEESRIPLQIQNTNSSPSETFLIKFQGVVDWCECPSIPSGESRTIHLAFHPQSKGKQLLPVLRIRMRSTPNLFFLWQNAEASEGISVLPKAIDHGISVSVGSRKFDDYELNTIDLIRDPRLFSKIDQKLFHKTGKPYLRAFRIICPEISAFLRWSDLKSVDDAIREEQFSFWIKYYQGIKHEEIGNVVIEAPFYTHKYPAAYVPWVELRKNYSDWLNEKQHDSPAHRIF